MSLTNLSAEVSLHVPSPIV